MTLAHTMGGSSGDTGTLEMRIDKVTSNNQETTKVDTEFPGIIAEIKSNPDLSSTGFLDAKNLHTKAKEYIENISQTQPVLAKQEEKAFEVQEVALFGAIRKSYDSPEDKRWDYPKRAIEEFLFGFSDDDFMPFENAKSLNMLKLAGLEDKILSSIELFVKREKTELEEYKTPSKEFLTGKILKLVNLKQKFGAPLTKFEEYIGPVVNAIKEEEVQSRYFEDVKSSLESMPGRKGDVADWKEYVKSHIDVLKEAVYFENENNNSGMPLEKALELISKNVFGSDLSVQNIEDERRKKLEAAIGKIRLSVLRNDDKGFYDSLEEYKDVLKSPPSDIDNPKSN